MNTKRKQDHHRSRIIFLQQFFARPAEVASIIPSSSYLVERLLTSFPHDTIKVAVEYGPGTGAITDRLLPLIPNDAVYIGAEPNATFREHLKDTHPRLELIADYAQNISSIVLARHGSADFIVSGLPCSVIPLNVLEQLFKSTHTLLRPGGEFRMFIYTHTLLLPKMHKMLKLLRQQFKEVHTASVWRNMPPATIIRCVK